MTLERLAVFDRRRAGVLLHLTALGPGAVGEPALRFIDWLADAGFSVWQFLPLGPVGADRSPYWVRSDFAANAELLPAGRVPAIAPRSFVEANADWLPDYALFAALARCHGTDWPAWPPALRDRDERALAAARRDFASQIESEFAAQCAFDLAWRRLRAHAISRDVRLVGDLPMYVAPDSVETWVHRREFLLGEDGRPIAVAGVPPDYFAAEGQLWGNPLYRWDYAASNGFAHFRRRVTAALRRCDLLRVDHFRALSAHWSVPAGALTARQGAWCTTPGGDVLSAVATDWPDLPLLAEDLGDISVDVWELRDRFALPGMQVLQFGFDGDPDNLHHPSKLRVHTAAYLGTHDNDTTLGWVLGLDSETQRRAMAQVGAARPADVPRQLTGMLLDSVAQLAVLSVPDLLGLGSEARFNTPGVASGNWSWQLPTGALDATLAQRLHRQIRAAGRV